MREAVTTGKMGSIYQVRLGKRLHLVKSHSTVDNGSTDMTYCAPSPNHTWSLLMACLSLHLQVHIHAKA
jgi:hypothetical protein